MENWNGYDVVFAGYLDWRSDVPLLIYASLESYDWEGKILIPFCTGDGSEFGRSLDKTAWQRAWRNHSGRFAYVWKQCKWSF